MENRFISWLIIIILLFVCVFPLNPFWENKIKDEKQVVEVIGQFETADYGQKGYIAKDGDQLIFLPFNKGWRADTTIIPNFVLLDTKGSFISLLNLDTKPKQ